MSDARDIGDQGASFLATTAQTTEGIWRGGIRPGDVYGSALGRPVVNAEMLERFAGVSGGGTPSTPQSVAGNAPNGGGLNLMSGIGLATGLYGLGTGLYDAIYGEDTETRVLGGANAAVSGIGAVGSAANIANVSTGFLGGMTSMGGAGLGGGGLAGQAGAASTWFGTAAGGGGATAAGVGTALTTGAAVIGAGLAGYGAGKFGDNHMAETGWLGRNSDGSGRSISDWGSDKAVAADEAVTGFIGGERGSMRSRLGGALGTAAGLGTVGFTSALGVPMAVGSAIHGTGSAIANLGGRAVDGIGNAMGGVADAFMRFTRPRGYPL